MSSSHHHPAPWWQQVRRVTCSEGPQLWTNPNPSLNLEHMALGCSSQLPGQTQAC